VLGYGNEHIVVICDVFCCCVMEMHVWQHAENERCEAEM